MNELGALYEMGDLVEQDYAKAAELYEMAADAGCFQSIINLGYIYEYGRTGKPDHTKAYQWYSLAAALAPSSEAVYKLGDMFGRGRAVPQDKSKAYRLYERSLELVRDDVEFVQPAIRIAAMLIDPDAPSCGIDRNPLRADALSAHRDWPAHRHRQRHDVLHQAPPRGDRRPREGPPARRNGRFCA